jgi:hypothetical protein
MPDRDPPNVYAEKVEAVHGRANKITKMFSFSIDLTKVKKLIIHLIKEFQNHEEFSAHIEK